VYWKLRDAWENEKTYPQLQKLPPDFYPNAANYLRSVKEQLVSSPESSPQRPLLLNELQVSRRLLRETLQERKRKIVMMLRDGNGVSAENLTGEEVATVGNLRDFIQKFESLEKSLPEGDITQAQAEAGAFTTLGAEQSRRVIVRLTQDLPAIVGVDLETYGPFKNEDIASIPEENASALVKQGAAKIIDLHPHEN
jgi:DNA replication factor GINS